MLNFELIRNNLPLLQNTNFITKLKNDKHLIAEFCEYWKKDFLDTCLWIIFLP